MKIILGSSSARRRRLLRKEGIEFEILNPEIDEDKFSSKDTIQSVKRISREKMKFIKEKIDEPALIITAGTLAEFQGRILAKPESKEEAAKWLKDFSGGCVNIHTGFSVSGLEKTNKGVETTKVLFKDLSEPEIVEYVNQENVQDLAGGFNIERGNKGRKLISSIEGSYSNVLGLPLERIMPLIEREKGKI